MAAGLASAAVVNLAPSVLSPYLVEDFELDRWQVGALIALFSVSGAVGSPGIGRFADRIGGTATLRLLFVGSIAGVLALALSPGFLAMAVIMLFAGSLGAAANPATNKLIAAFVAAPARGTVVGIKQAGGPMGLTLLGLVPVLAAAAGWRWALLSVLMVPLVGLLSMRRIIGDREEPRTAGARRAGHDHRRVVRTLALQGFLVGGAGVTLLGFIPLYAQEVLGFSKVAAGGAVSVLGVIGIFARVGWGWQQKRFSHLATPLGLISLLSIAATVLVWGSPSGGDWMLWAGAGLAGGSFLAWNTIAMVAIVERIGPEAAGSASGDVTSGYLIGWSVTPWIFGLVVDTTGTYGWAWAGVVGMFGVAIGFSERWRRAAA